MSSPTIIGFSRPRKPTILTRLAMWLDDKSEYSHTFMMYEDSDWKCSEVIQVDELGFRIVPLSKFIKKNEVMLWFDTSVIPNFENGLAEVAREHCADGYDFKGFSVIGILLAIKKIFKRRIKNPVRTKDTIFCSETCALALKLSGCPEFTDVEPEDVTPKALENLLLEKFPEGFRQRGHPLPEL